VVGAPKNAPAEIIDKLNEEINAALADPKMKAQIVDLGGTVLPGSPAASGKLIADETEKWGKVVKFACPLLLQLQASCCNAANRGFGPKAVVLPVTAGDGAVSPQGGRW
jgi:Tripartite tricarboxylate transporter family receptor